MRKHLWIGVYDGVFQVRGHSFETLRHCIRIRSALQWKGYLVMKHSMGVLGGEALTSEYTPARKARELAASKIPVMFLSLVLFRPPRLDIQELQFAMELGRNTVASDTIQRGPQILSKAVPDIGPDNRSQSLPALTDRSWNEYAAQFSMPLIQDGRQGLRVDLGCGYCRWLG